MPLAAGAKHIGFGLALAGGPSTVATEHVAGIVSMSGPEASAEIVGELTLDSTTLFMDRYKAGIDPGDVSLTLAYSSTDASQKMLGTALGSTVAYFWRTYIPGSTATPEDFFGYLSGMGRSIERAAVIQRTVTIAVTGDPGYPTT